MSRDRFAVQVQIDGHTLDVVGTISPYRPATGPTMAHAGGEPAEGGDVEILSAKLVFTRKDHATGRRVGYAYRPLCAEVLEGLQDRDIDDKVREALEDA